MNILIIDDKKEIYTPFLKTCEMKGYVADFAVKVSDAVSLLTRRKSDGELYFDLVIIDITLKGEKKGFDTNGGLAVLKHLNELDKTHRIVKTVLCEPVRFQDSELSDSLDKEFRNSVRVFTKPTSFDQIEKHYYNVLKDRDKQWSGKK